MKIQETDRLILRKWNFKDVADLYEYARDEKVGPSAGWKPHKSKEESYDIIKRFIKEDDTLAIELKENGKVIGSVGLHATTPDRTRADYSQLEVGYVLNSNYWGNGYVPEAVEQLKKYAFDELDIDLLWCGHYDFNMKSKRVTEKCGFKYQFTTEMVLPLLDNKQVNMLYYIVENPNRKE